MTTTVVAATPPVTRRVRAYFAPVNRAAATPSIFDAAQTGAFSLDAPPAPWVDLGWCTGFTRKSGTKVAVVQLGSPAITQSQMRTEVEATVSLQFESWGKLQLALAAGSQQMNLLQTATGAAANGSGGIAATAAPLTPDGTSTATRLSVGAAAATAFSAGDLVAVDVDYSGQTGFVGSGVSAAYVRSSSAVGGDANYVRRVSLNVGRVVAVNEGSIQLAAPLPAGVPTTAMKVSALAGFVDREGGSFFQEWSALFVMQGEQGDRVIFHYPRLQAMQGSAEVVETLVAPLEQMRLAGAFRALPVKDANDGEMVLCFRSYLPGAMRAV
ncbi:hypothetical protein [Granulicella arctica]|uniref:Uncharacterized protein n=1 Tax=Granulicella arctica TaxID=940613 RepID=A0A7Y9TJS5_9BACT|nr:hypothetical protein [Granulicella arctica]NYF78567.1 hypothetical protein [Granulicella arctica]